MLLKEVELPSTAKQIVYSFENLVQMDYQTLALGKGRLYRGLNPDLSTTSTFNFDYDNETYNQIYFN